MVAYNANNILTQIMLTNFVFRCIICEVNLFFHYGIRKFSFSECTNNIMYLWKDLLNIF